MEANTELKEVEPNNRKRPARKTEVRDPFIYLEAPNEPVAEMDHLFHSTEDAQFWERLTFTGVICCCGKLLQNEILHQQHRSLHHSEDESYNRRFKCSDCNLRFSLPLQLAEHRKDSEDKVFYRCKICNVLTKQWKHLEVHFEFTRFHPVLELSEAERIEFEAAVETIQPEDGRCCGCDQTFPSGEELYQHANESHNPDEHPQFACTTCYQNFSDWNSLIRHQKLFIGERTFKCRVDDCRYESESRQTIKKHAETEVHCSLADLASPSPVPVKEEEPVKYHCCFSSCYETFQEWEELNRHCTEEHAERRAFNYNHSKEATENVCSLCARIFPTDKLYASHIESLTAPKAMCTICGKTVTRYGIAKHMKLHDMKKRGQSAKQHTCKECSKVYATKVGLQKHEKRDHLNEFPEKCTLCEKKFILKSDLKHHMAMRHIKDRPYKCSQCSLSFVTKQQLARHEATHTDSRPYCCNYCSNTYRHDADRKRHEQATHLNVKPHKCQQCTAAFVRERDLRQHLAVHTRV